MAYLVLFPPVAFAVVFALVGEESRGPGWAWFLLSLAAWVGAQMAWEGGIARGLANGVLYQVGPDNIVVGVASQAALYGAITIYRMVADRNDRVR